MVNITVCVGSSCHMKGSHHAIDRLGELIKEHHMEDAVELKASFCMHRCRGNIGMTIDDRIITDFTKDNVDEVFLREMYGSEV